MKNQRGTAAKAASMSVLLAVAATAATVVAGSNNNSKSDSSIEYAASVGGCIGRRSEDGAHCLSTTMTQSQINLQRPRGEKELKEALDALRELKLKEEEEEESGPGGIRRVYHNLLTNTVNTNDQAANIDAQKGGKSASRRLQQTTQQQQHYQEGRVLIHDFNQRQSSHRLLGGAFNPNLEQFDPHGDPTNGVGGVGAVGIVDNDLAIQAYGAPESFIQCPPEIEGNRASYDCTSYVYCSKGQIRGTFHSCMGLKFDNERSVCDWEESVVCEGYVAPVVSVDTDADGGDGKKGKKDNDGSSSSGGVVENGGKEKIMASALTGVNAKSKSDNGDEEGQDPFAWNGNGDWGGAWIQGVWVPDGEQPKSPAQSPGSSGGGAEWKDVPWPSSLIGPFPPHPVLPFERARATAAAAPIDVSTSNNQDTNSTENASSSSSSSPKAPSEYTSSEGWSYQTRQGKTVIGYYASWQWYDNTERAKPKNLNFQKVDRVNFAFFQTDKEGNIWGTDSWADPITLFGPHDWMIDVSEDAGYAPQFNDDNGFDDSSGGEYNYVGDKYVDLGEHVHCHRAYATGKRECVGHRTEEGLIGRAHEQGAYVFPSIGGWSLSDPFPKLAASAKSRRNFAKNCVGLIREYGFDGIDIDWEYPTYKDHSGTPQDTKNFVLLLNDIRAALDAYQTVAYPNGEKTFGLTAALPCGHAIIDNQDVPGISAVLTELNLMTYDFHGTWDDLVGVNAPLYDQDPKKFESVNNSVNGCFERWVNEGADKSKINIGLPFYGRSFGSATALYTTHSGSDGIHWWADEGMPQYSNILNKLPEMITLRDDTTMTQYAYFDDGKGGLVSFDDQQAICDKVDYASQHNLNGMIIWELSGDLTEQLNTPLLDVVNLKLQRGNAFDCEMYRVESRDEDGNIVSQDTGPQFWYVSWEEGSCINDGRQPEWMKEGEDLFRFKQECCGYKFEYKFDECVGPPTKEPTEDPSPSPTTSPVVRPSVSPSTMEPTHVFGAAQVIISGGPTVLTARSAKDSGGGEPEPPVTWCFGGCKGDNEICAGNQNHPQAIDDDTCKACMEGQTYWPCDVDGLCFCWDPATPRVPPAPASGLAQLSDERPCDYFTEDLYDELAPDAQFPYTYQGFCDAIDHYNDHHAEKIFMMGTEEERKKELAMFLGHTLHESDEWKASREYLMCSDTQETKDGEVYCKPCTADEFDWETFKCVGVGLAGGGLTFNGYCDYTIEPPLACPCEEIAPDDSPFEGYIPASKVFFGRGAIQLSWNYNFRSASDALTGDPTTFCDDPDLVATTPEYAWGAGVFFWMENLKEETTCHIEALKHHDFGGTLNNINGGLECPAYHGGWHGEAIKLRLDRYCKATEVLELASISTMTGCKGLNESFAECLGDGTCPHCAQFSDGTETLFISHHGDVSTSTVSPDTTGSTSTTDMVETTSISEATGTATTEAPEATEVPETTEAPETTEVPETTEAPETTEIPETTEAPETTEIPETTEAPETTEIPETTKPTDAATVCEDGLLPVDGLPGCCLPEPAYLGDGACDPDAPYNTPECNFDNGDCCKETCNLDSTYACSQKAEGFGPFGYYCLDPKHSNVDPEVCNVVDRTRIGDGRCDPENNIPECDYDAGDCCEKSCDPTYAYFDCGDDTFPYDCKNPDFAELVEMDTAVTLPAPTTPTESLEEVVTDDNDSSVLDIVFVQPSQDASLSKNEPKSNFGSEPTLQLRGPSSGPLAQDAIMKFDIPASEHKYDEVVAVLRVYAVDDSSTGGIFHLAPESSPWHEDSVTWENAPDWSTRLDNIGSLEAGNWYTIDVSDAIDDLHGYDGSINIRVRSRDPGVSTYSSKEGDFPPEIMITYYGPGGGDGQNNVVIATTATTIAAASTSSATTSSLTTSMSTTSSLETSSTATGGHSTTTLSESLTCSTDLHVCPDGSFVARVMENNCEFAECPNVSENSYGQYWPVWGKNGAVGCVDGEPPAWAMGAYLKDSKSECCDAYFMLQKEDCLSS